MLKRLLKRIFGIKTETSVDVSAPAREEFNTVPHAQSIQVVEQTPNYPIPVEDIQDVEDPECRTQYVQCANTSGLHNMAYHEWGDPNNQNVLICVHGLTRRGSDFNVLAKAMSDRYRVICPDVVGRGDSNWLPNPMLYGIPQYVADMVTLIARLGVEKVDWFGTSMGGLIGIFLASQEHSPIRRMILNDVGPKIESAALKRLGFGWSCCWRFRWRRCWGLCRSRCRRFGRSRCRRFAWGRRWRLGWCGCRCRCISRG